MILPWPCRIPLAKSPLYFPSCPITSTRFIFAFNIAFRDFGFVAFSLAFSISNSVPIDIADISVAGVGQISNVGAKLETDRADADKIMRQAEAEGRKAMAIAEEQEMRARVQERQAKEIEAQAEVPLALAEAFRQGNLGVMDFYRMQNIMADTSMRESLAGGDDEQSEE